MKKRAIYKIIITEDVDRNLDGEWILNDKFTKDVYLFGVRLYHRNFTQKTVPVEIEDRKVGFNTSR